MSNTLFSDFKSVSSKEWKQKIQVDLKGKDYNETLVWQSLEGIHVKPFYHQDEFVKAPLPIPGNPTHWQVTQQVFIDDVKISNFLIKDALQRGAEALFIVSEIPFKPQEVFENIDLMGVSIYFQLSFLEVDFYAALLSFLEKQNAKTFLRFDIIGNLTKDGNWFQSLDKDHEILASVLTKHPKATILGIDTSGYQNAGANCVQQLAYSLAHANEYLHHFPSHKDLQLTFTLAIGSNYFFEIAKIRALRILYSTLAEAYQVPLSCTILAVPSKRNKTLYDYNLNMLRTTTECMSAVLGGVNAVCNLPYDAIFHKSNEFGERISRNQLLILKAESYFDAVSNPANGSYYIESLTEELAEKALQLFKDIEKNGGFLKQLKDGTIQKKIKESAQKEQQWFDEGKLVLVGTNKYPSEKDKMKNDLELYPFVKHKPRKTLIEPIVEKRLAEANEQNRLENE